MPLIYRSLPKASSAGCPRPGGSKGRPHPFHETTCLLGRIYPGGFCAWSCSSKAQQRHLDTFPTHGAISRDDHPQNGVCPLLPLIIPDLLPSLCVQSSVWSQSGLRGIILGDGGLEASSLLLWDFQSVC